MKSTTLVSTLLVSLALACPQAAIAVDAGAAQALAKKEGCLKCHGIDKAKEAKSIKDIAKKYKGKADADARIFEQITTGAKVKLEDGSEEEHKIIKTKDKAAIDNLIGWLRSHAK